MSRCFVLSRGTKGLWSVSILKCNLLQAHTMARASFSIWAYLCSVSVSAFEANATGFHEPCSSWRRTAPKLYDEASVDILVATWGLYNARVDGFVISCFKAASGSWMSSIKVIDYGSHCCSTVKNRKCNL